MKISSLCFPALICVSFPTLGLAEDLRLKKRDGAETIAVVHATVIDGTGAAPMPDATVLIRGNVIVAIGPSGKVAVPSAARRLNGTGKFVIPGLWDMHTHVDDPELLELNPKPEEKAQWLPVFVLNGVTGIREMAGEVALIKGWQKQIAAGKLFGPRIWHGGPLVDGPKPMWPASIAVNNAEEGRQAVRNLKAQGVDFIKAYSLLSPESFFAVCDEAHKVGLPVCGHVPFAVKNADACKAGLNSIEHLLQLDSELADPVKVKEMRAALPPITDRFARFRANAEINEKCYSTKLADEMFKLYRERKTWLTPTLMVAYEDSTYNPDDPLMKARERFIPAYVREWWSPEKNVHIKDQTPDLRAGQQVRFRMYKRIVGDLVKAKVPMMTGSDMGGNPHCFGGWGVHDELRCLVEAGMSPMEAIRSATSNPAKYLGIYDRIGSIEKGKLADLVILSANPLADITNSTSIEDVIYDGKLYGRDMLNRMFNEQAAAVAKRR